MKTRNNTAVDNRPDIFVTFNHFKDKLKKNLNLMYPKAFKSNYKPNFFNKNNRFSVKQPIAQVLDVYCDKLNYGRSEIAYFIKFYEESAKANEIIDPVSMFDCMHAKATHGNLGRLLYRHSDDVRDIRNLLEHQIAQESDQLNDNLLLSHHYLSYAKEMLFNKQLSSTFNNFSFKEYPIPDYHIKQITKLKIKMKSKETMKLQNINEDKILNNQKNKKENNEPDQKNIDKSYIQIQNLQYSQLQAQAEQEIIELRVKRIELDIINMIISSKSEIIDIDKLLIIAIKKEILNNFLECIVHEQKQFLFRWYAYAKVNGLDPAYSENEADKYLPHTDSVLRRAKNLYDDETNEGYNDLLYLDYFKENIKPDLISDDVLLDNEKIMKTFNETEQDYLERNSMHKYNQLKAEAAWGIMFTFDNCKWEEIWKTFVNKNLKEPLKKADRLLEFAKTNPVYSSGVELIALINQAKVSAYPIEKMQANRNIQLQEVSVPIQQIAKNRSMKF